MRPTREHLDEKIKEINQQEVQEEIKEMKVQFNRIDLKSNHVSHVSYPQLLNLRESEPPLVCI